MDVLRTKYEFLKPGKNTPRDYSQFQNGPITIENPPGQSLYSLKKPSINTQWFLNTQNNLAEIDFQGQADD